jgi:hypothetical protein
MNMYVNELLKKHKLFFKKQMKDREDKFVKNSSGTNIHS